MVGLGVLVVVALSFSWVVEVSPVIPDYAKFRVLDSRKVLIPSPPPSQFPFYPIEGLTGDERWRTASWIEIRKSDGPFADYHLPNGAGWDSWEWYHSQPMLMDWIRPGSTRWDSLGYWRY